MIFSSEPSIDTIEEDLRYIKLLASKHPTIPDACTEIINLEAILNLPKGTEHFLTDVHGEYESFNHVLRNASGVVKRKINDIFGASIRDSEKKELATIIYYPDQKLDLAIKEEVDIDDWYRTILHKLIKISRTISSKYTRSKVRKALPADFSYIIEELLHEQQSTFNKQEYYNGIIDTIIKIGRAKEFIVAISNLIQRLTIDRLHILGDIYDRGPGAHIILDTLMHYHSVDIQWGNHDILWMGAAAGSESCIANVLRISTRYANLDTIEEGYGINLLPLATFALDFYNDDPCESFKPKVLPENNYREKDLNLMSQMHKAISVIQFKLEAEIIKRRPNYEMESRLLLHKIDYEKGIVNIDGKDYTLNDTNFPTIDPKDPYKLTEEERELIDKLKSSFSNSEKLQGHVRFLYSKGSMYLKYNSNLLYHGCIALNQDGSFKKIKVNNTTYSGKSYIDKTERVAREAYFGKVDSDSKLYALDSVWYLWCGSNSPLFGKDKMTTFERYFIDDKSTHVEIKNPYYKYRDDETICNNILTEFGLDPTDSHIINGHIPVKTIQGESPIKANGKLLVIDGGFSKAYQPQTGIAGYTLIYNSYGLLLVSHTPFESTQKAIDEGKDIFSSTIVLEKSTNRKRVIDTDVGLEIKEQINDLQLLLMAYRKGLIKEQR